MTATDLTAKQAKILRWIIAYKSAREIPPTIREICTEFRFSSPNGALGHLDALEKKGYIARSDKKARSIRVLKGPDGKGVESLTTEAVERAVADLFLCGTQKASRLVLVDDDKPEGDFGWNLGGWCPEAITDRLCKAFGLPMPERKGR
jgi:hypothetical protein